MWPMHDDQLVVPMVTRQFIKNSGKNRGKWNCQQLPEVELRTLLAWAASALPLSHDNRTTTNPHNPLYVLHRWYWMPQLHTWQPLRMCHWNISFTLSIIPLHLATSWSRYGDILQQIHVGTHRETIKYSQNGVLVLLKPTLSCFLEGAVRERARDMYQKGYR